MSENIPPPNPTALLSGTPSASPRPLSGLPTASPSQLSGAPTLGPAPSSPIIPPSLTNNSNQSTNSESMKPNNVNVNMTPSENTNYGTNQALENQPMNNTGMNNTGMNNTGMEGEPGEDEDLILQSDAIHRIPELELSGRGKKTALIVVNVQNCFFRGGAMAMFPSEKTSEDIEKEKNLIRRINNLIGLYEEDEDYFNAGLGGSPVIKGEINVKTDPSTGMKHLDGTYPTGSRKKYFFDHIVYTQTAFPADHHTFASYHYLREKKQRIKDIMESQSINYEDAHKKITDDQLDKYYWGFVNTNFENSGMIQYDEETGSKLWPDHALLDGTDVVIENKRCYRGIDFHPRLNLAPLYCPNQNLNPQVYINPPVFDGRGKVVWLLGDDQTSPRSAFLNNINQSTGLLEYLQDKNIEEIYVVGMFRDMMVEATAVDAAANGFPTVNLVYDATLPFNIPTNNTGVNNKMYFRNIGEINKYLDLTNDVSSETKYYDYLRDKNIWAQNIEAKNVRLINYQNIIENIKVGKEEFSCGLTEDDLIKTFDIFLKTSTSTSRGEGIIV